MEASCPNCGTKYRVSDAAVGKQVRCKNPDCRQTFTVRPASQEPPGAEVPVVGPAPQDQGTVEGQGPPGVAPPPLPPGIETARQLSPEEILAGYQRTSKAAGPGIKEKLKLGVAAVSKRARALKLKHDVKNLQIAIEGQHESLGALTLQHHPAQLDIHAETAELSQIQEQLAQKQATRDALRSTKGSGSAVKELDREMGQLRGRQHELMIAIGGKAEAAKTEMPGAAGHYSGIDQLRSSVAAKQSELRTLEEQIGPILEGRGSTLAGLKKPLIIAGAALGGILLVWLVWTAAHAILSGGEIDFHYVPRNAVGVAYVDVEKLRGTDLYEYLEDMIQKETRRMPVQLQPEDVKSLFAAMLGEDEGIGVVRTYEDLPLEDVLSAKEGKLKIDDYKQVEYARIENYGCVAKTGKHTYCFADDEKTIKQTVDRLRKNEKGELSEAMQTALDYARGEDHYVVMDARMFASGIPPGGSQEFLRGLKSVGIGTSVDSSSVSVSGVFVFRRDRDAEDFADGYEQAIEAFESSLKSPYMPKPTRDAFEAMGEMLRELKVKQSGEMVRFQGSWKLSDIEGLIEQFSGINTL